MALRQLSRLVLSHSRSAVQSQRQQLHMTSRTSFFWWGKDKPIPNDEALAVGYEKIVLEAAKVGEDPLEVFNRDQPSKPISGDGTRDSPFVIPSNVPERYVIVNDPEMEGGVPPGFWLTLEEGGRCPVTGQHYKLHLDTSDKWGISELDLFKH